MKHLLIAAVLVAATSAQAQSFDCQQGAPKTEKIGAYTFKQVCQTKGAGDQRHSIGYPQIASDDPSAAKWNALAAKAAAALKEGTDDYYSVNITYKIGTASAHLISVHYELNGQGARAVFAESDFVALMPAAAPLKASDLFKVTPQWKAFLAAQANAAFKASVGQTFTEQGTSNDAVTKFVTDPTYWFFDAKGLTVDQTQLLPPPQPDITATIPWSALKPYLAAGVPVP